MIHTKQFIEDAIKGGWNHKLKRLPHYNVLLDPLAWQAVGKTRGWTEYPTKRNVIGDSWKEYIHRFIDHLADGKSIEEALGLIS